ncbi:MAG TPA: bifunctional folylpolyglutamate synthase/dihydrofolate synthase [Candidatus Merdenecus merdavium]|nr:bifunctional folylpolyglutamate synthase/dihydrofolate synthase [Candidatus Merdenecus merdavium]
MDYKEVLEYIYDIPKFTKKNKLEDTKLFLNECISEGIEAKIIHVAGTNGKGSVCAFLESILRYSGKKTGMFTSPHLEKINERFQINRQPISDEEVVQAFERVMSVIDKMKTKGFAHPTFFETIFLMAMEIFHNNHVDYILLETGLGGRLDATNAIEHPLLTMITSISLDHTEILGDSIDKIAFEKAGIIKSGVPVVYDGTNQIASKVIEEQARFMGAPTYPVHHFSDEELMNDGKGIDFLFRSRYYGHIDLHMNTIAKYQMRNASLSIKALEILDKNHEIPVSIIQKGIANTLWKGRMEQIRPGIFLDGAHNEAGVSEFIQTVKSFEGKRIVLLFSAVKEKNYHQMIQTLCKNLSFHAVVVTSVGADRQVLAKDLGAIFESYGQKNVFIESQIDQAYEEALAQKGEGILFCVGSLYLIGELEKIIRRSDHD